MQFTWNIAQGVSSYNKQTGFGFVIGAAHSGNEQQLFAAVVVRGYRNL